MPKLTDKEKNQAAVLREQETVTKMIRIYCRAHHHTTGDLCDQCQALRDYAVRRIETCIFQPEKPTCGKCPVHCYKPAMREQIRRVMRYSGPRLILRDPIASFRHLAQMRRKPSLSLRIKAKNQDQASH